MKAYTVSETFLAATGPARAAVESLRESGAGAGSICGGGLRADVDPPRGAAAPGDEVPGPGGVIGISGGHQGAATQGYDLHGLGGAAVVGEERRHGREDLPVVDRAGVPGVVAPQQGRLDEEALAGRGAGAVHPLSRAVDDPRRLPQRQPILRSSITQQEHQRNDRHDRDDRRAGLPGRHRRPASASPSA